MELPKYRCHKEVEGFRIAEIRRIFAGRVFEKNYTVTGATLVPVLKDVPQIDVGAEYLKKHKPYVGGYYVLYEDGYESFSPAKAFKDGYKRVVVDGWGKESLVACE